MSILAYVISILGGIVTAVIIFIIVLNNCPINIDLGDYFLNGFASLLAGGFSSFVAGSCYAEYHHFFLAFIPYLFVSFLGGGFLGVMACGTINTGYAMRNNQDLW